MIKWLRWVAVLPAAYFGWVAAFLFGLVELRVLDSFCPADQWESGMCIASWYEQGFLVAECLAAAVAAFLVVIFAAIVAPAHRVAVSRAAYLVGAAFACYFSFSASLYWALALALLGGLSAVAMVARRFGADARGPNNSIKPTC